MAAIDYEPMPWCVPCRSYHHESAPHVFNQADYIVKLEARVRQLEAWSAQVSLTMDTELQRIHSHLDRLPVQQAE